jgi:hypothetical protein
MPWHNFLIMPKLRSRKRRIRRSFGRLAVILFVLSAAYAHAPATVAFQFDFPGSDPAHYRLSVDSTGHATYESNGKLNAQVQGGDVFHREFTLKPATCSRIFDLAKRAHYFKGKVDSGKANLASTGAKTLSYDDGATSTTAEYNFSPIVAVEDLTALFQNLSATLEFGRRLDYYHRYQKLALDDELKQMEDSLQSGDGDMVGLEAIAPTLQEIVHDPTVLNVDRARALRLLAHAGISAQ